MKLRPGPLAFTKTYAMAAAAGLSVTLIPILLGYWIRGRIPDEQRNPITRALIAVYRPALEWVLQRPKATLAIAVLAFATTLWPVSQLGGEFLLPLDGGICSTCLRLCRGCPRRKLRSCCKSRTA